VSQTYEIDTQLQRNTNVKSYVAYRLTLSDLEGHLIYLKPF